MNKVRERDEAAAAKAVVAELETFVERLGETAVAPGERLEALTRVLAVSDRLHAAAVGLVGEVAADPAAADGLGVAGFLRLFARRTGGDAGMLCATADRLVHLPTVARLFADGELGWPAVRGIVAATRHLSVAQLAWVDAAVAADGDRWVGMDADVQVDAVHQLAERARPDLVRDKTARQYEDRFLSLQPGLDGSLALYGELDAEAGAAVLEALDAPPPGDGARAEDALDQQDPTDPDGRAYSKGRRQADRLVQRCRHRCSTRRDRTTGGDERGGADEGAAEGSADGGYTGDGGGSGLDGEPSREGGDELTTDGGPDAAVHDDGERDDGVGVARPALLVLTDIKTLAGGEDLAESVTGSMARVLWRSGRGPVSLSGEAVRRLSCDATLRQIFTDGHTILGAGPEQQAVPPALRACLIARDEHCRFPGCRAAAAWCDAHHIVPRGRGGPMRLPNLVLICRRHHRAVHDHGWKLTLDPETDQVTVRKGRKTATSPARAARTLRAPPPPKGRRNRADRKTPTSATSKVAGPRLTDEPEPACPF